MRGPDFVGRQAWNRVGIQIVLAALFVTSGGAEPRYVGDGMPLFRLPLAIEPSSPKITSMNFVDRSPAGQIWTTWNPGYQNETYDGHVGTDFFVPKGTDVVAAANGVVVYFADDDPNDDSMQRNIGARGNYVIIEHQDKVRAYYGHLLHNSVVVGMGETVLQGQKIAQVASSGDSTNYHLHFEVHYYPELEQKRPNSIQGGEIVDPFSLDPEKSWWINQYGFVNSQIVVPSESAQPRFQVGELVNVTEGINLRDEPGGADSGFDSGPGEVARIFQGPVLAPNPANHLQQQFLWWKVFRRSEPAGEYWVAGQLLRSSQNFVNAYHVQAISPLPGPEPSEMWANAINSEGAVVGYQREGGSNRAFIWNETEGTKELPGIGGASTVALAINCRETVVGFSGQRGVVWSDGTTQNIVDIATELPVSNRPYLCRTISDTGHIGCYGDSVFRIQSGQVMGLPSSDRGQALAGNSLGAVSGSSGTPSKPTIWDSQSLEILQVDGQSLPGEAHDINDFGHAVGYAHVGGIGNLRAYLWHDRLSTELPSLGGNSQAWGISDRGLIVGLSEQGGRQRAVLWSETNEGYQVVDLNSLIPEDENWQLISATDVNEKGEIVGRGILNGEARGFVLLPNQTSVSSRKKFGESVVLAFGKDAPFRIKEIPFFIGEYDDRTDSTAAYDSRSALNPDYEEEVLGEVRKIFADSGISSVTVDIGDPDPQAITIYFADFNDQADSLTHKGYAVGGVDRFNKEPGGEAIVYALPTKSLEDAETVAHEIGHLLGLAHIDPNVGGGVGTEIMDREFDLNFGPRAFASVPALIDNGIPEFLDINIHHNPMYHIRRYVEHLPHDELKAANIHPGGYDTDSIGSRALSLLLFQSARELYDVRVHAFSPGHESPQVVAEFETLSLAGLSNRTLIVDEGTRILVTAATVPNGPIDAIVGNADQNGNSVTLSADMQIQSAALYLIRNESLVVEDTGVLRTAVDSPLPQEIKMCYKFEHSYVVLDFMTKANFCYEVERSRDLHQWRRIGTPFLGDGSKMEFRDLAPLLGSGFYRMRIQSNKTNSP